MNGPRVQVHRREGNRRSPDPGDLRAIYGGHPDRVPVTAGPGGPVVRRDLAATPDRAARRRVTIISAPAGGANGRRSGSPARPGTCILSWRTRSLAAARWPAGCWPPRPGLGRLARPGPGSHAGIRITGTRSRPFTLMAGTWRAPGHYHEKVPFPW